MAGIELIDIHKTYLVDNREIPVLNGDQPVASGGENHCGFGAERMRENDASAADRRTGDGGQRRDPLGERPQDGICLSGTAPHAVVDRLGKCGVRAFKKGDRSGENRGGYPHGRIIWI